MFAIAGETSGSNWQNFFAFLVKSKLEELRGHKIVLVMSHKLDLLLLSSSQCDKNIKLLEDLNKDKYRILTAEQKTAQKNNGIVKLLERMKSHKKFYNL